MTGSHTAVHTRVVWNQEGGIPPQVSEGIHAKERSFLQRKLFPSTSDGSQGQEDS